MGRNGTVSSSSKARPTEAVTKTTNGTSATKKPRASAMPWVRATAMPAWISNSKAIAIGLVRMGILHNVAVLNGARPPDHADGGVRDWVERREATYTRAVTELEATRDDLPSPPVSMQIVVDGQPAGEATVWIDPSLGLPIERHQVVVFPEGEMRVRESYTWH